MQRAATSVARKRSSEFSREFRARTELLPPLVPSTASSVKSCRQLELLAAGEDNEPAVSRSSRVPFLREKLYTLAPVSPDFIFLSTILFEKN